MTLYAYIEFGLRGCYADGGGEWCAFKTRSHLKDTIAAFGGDELSTRDAASLAARVWRDHKARRTASLAYVAPIRKRPAFGVHVCVGTRAEYLANVED